YLLAWRAHSARRGYRPYNDPLQRACAQARAWRVAFAQQASPILNYRDGYCAFFHPCDSRLNAPEFAREGGTRQADAQTQCPTLHHMPRGFANTCLFYFLQRVAAYKAILKPCHSSD